VVGRLSVDHLDLLEAEAVEEETILAGLVGRAHRGVVGADGHGDPVLEEGVDRVERPPLHGAGLVVRG
jgi:hypothetical protein